MMVNKNGREWVDVKGESKSSGRRKGKRGKGSVEQGRMLDTNWRVRRKGKRTQSTNMLTKQHTMHSHISFINTTLCSLLTII